MRALRQEGVDRIFGLGGDHINFEAWADLGVRIIDTRHESAAATIAGAWAGATGRPGVGMVTGGPGHTSSREGAGSG